MNTSDDVIGRGCKGRGDSGNAQRREWSSGQLVAAIAAGSGRDGLRRGGLGRSRLRRTDGSRVNGFRWVEKSELSVVRAGWFAGSTEDEEVAVAQLDGDAGLARILAEELPVDAGAIL